jgi:hypothetical protein
MKFLISTVKDKDAQLGSNSSPVDYNSLGGVVAKLIAVYMVTDTFRKIIIHTVATKIN